MTPEEKLEIVKPLARFCFAGAAGGLIMTPFSPVLGALIGVPFFVALVAIAKHVYGWPER